MAFAVVEAARRSDLQLTRPRLDVHASLRPVHSLTPLNGALSVGFAVGISHAGATRAMRLRSATASGLSPYGSMGISRHHSTTFAGRSNLIVGAQPGPARLPIVERADALSRLLVQQSCRAETFGNLWALGKLLQSLPGRRARGLELFAHGGRRWSAGVPPASRARRARRAVRSVAQFSNVGVRLRGRRDGGLTRASAESTCVRISRQSPTISRPSEAAMRPRKPWTTSVASPKFVCIRPAMHPGWRRCSSLKYSRYSWSSRLASRAPRRPRCNNELRRRDTRRSGA